MAFGRKAASLARVIAVMLCRQERLRLRHVRFTVLAGFAMAVLVGCRAEPVAKIPPQEDAPGDQVPAAPAKRTSGEVRALQLDGRHGSRQAIFMPDGKHVLTAAGTIWGVESGEEKPIVKLRPGARWPIAAGAIVPGMPHVFKPELDARLQLWDLQTGLVYRLGNKSSRSCSVSSRWE